MPDDPVERSPTIFAKTSRWFDRARAALLDTLPCRQGCSRCCVGLFPVTILDQQEIRRGLRSLPQEQRRVIERTAVLQAEKIASDAPQLTHTRFIDHWSDRDIDRLVDQYRDLPCPALASDGSCSLYEFRPLACRSMGIPSETDGVVHGACPVQTSTPLIQLSRTLRQEEDRLAGAEADALALLQQGRSTQAEELLLPYAFLPDTVAES